MSEDDFKTIMNRNNVCRYHFDSGPSITAVLAVVDNGELCNYGTGMEGALLGYSDRKCGTVRMQNPGPRNGKLRAATYSNTRHTLVEHGDVYVFVGCAIARL